MNEFKKIILQQNEKDIYRDVTDLTDIIVYLLSKNIISSQDRETIANNTPMNKTAMLMKLLYQKEDGSAWFEEFLIALSRDYSWISDKLSEQYYHEENNRKTFYLSGKGQVPPLPQHNVTRTSYVEELRKAIAKLRREDFLVVHGMPGWGKTCLVIDALNNISLLEDSLEGCVYWISVGDMGDEPDDLQCKQLQKKLCDMVNLPINTQQDYFIQLKRYFSIRPNISALLVLDKVKSSKVVDALNVGCKVLVTTQNTDVVKKYSRKQFFHIQKGFSESESVKLLQDFVYDDKNLGPSLKDIAIKIHHSWKGHPMAIGLIGGELCEFKEESQKDVSRWKQHVRSHQGDVETRRNSLVIEQLSSVIELTTSKLNDNHKKRFEMLVVLVEDTNITIDVLKILWDLDRSEVISTLDQFYKKSLVFKKFNLKDVPVYGIHDMLMDYLMKITSPSTREELNKDLVHKYIKACNNNFANLPQDNYIFSYLCHHIEFANLWEECRDQLFTLRYIESKLRATGPADLLLDLSKYKSGLSGSNSEYHSKIADIKQLVEDSGWDIHFSNEIDIVQCALLQSKKSYLYKEGVELAKASNAETVYFCPRNSWEKPKDLEVEVTRNVTAVSLTNSSVTHANERVLMYPYECDNKSYIGELDLRYRLPRRYFYAGDAGDVVMLKVSPSGDRFLSAHSNGFINMWSLASADTPPPSMRQKDFSPFYCDIRTTPSLSFSHYRKVTCACFSSNGKLVLSTSEDGNVHVWNLENNSTVNRFSVHPNPYAISCSFISGDKLIAYACQNFKIFCHELQNNKPFSDFQLKKEHGNLVCLLSVSEEDKKLLVVQEKAVHLCHWEHETLQHRSFGDRDLLFRGTFTQLHSENRNTITCAAYGGKQRLLLGTNHGCQLYDMSNANHQHLTFGSGRINAVDMVDSRALFVRNGMIKLCCFESISNIHASGKLPSIAHVGWNSRDVSVYTTATTNGEIQVYHDGKVIYDDAKFRTFPSIVRCHRDQVLMGTSDGQVLLIDTVSKNTHHIREMSGMEVEYIGVETDESNSFYVVGSKQNKNVSLQIFNHNNGLILSCEISAPVAKTFISSQHSCLIVVLRDYSILAYSFKNQHLSMLHDGRETANVTDACISSKRGILFVTDKENCYHVFHIKWPLSNVTNNINEALNMKPLLLPLTEGVNLKKTVFEPSDEVDGIRLSSLSTTEPRVSLSTQPLKGPSWCCCICPKEDFVAIGYDDNRILIYDIRKGKAINEFQVQPNRQTRIHQLKFSPYDVKFHHLPFKLILFVVTDRVSLWNISPLILDNANYAIRDIKCVGCVNASGNPLLELAINDSCNKFCAFDKNFSYFLWNIWEEDK